MIIHKLYCEDGRFFDAIQFHQGLNIIMGEKSDQSEKRNGVGKSISIEFINFALLKDFNKSRLSKLPKDVLEMSSPIMLDLSIGGQDLTIKRALQHDSIVYIQHQSLTTEYTLADARHFLLSRFDFNRENLYLSFRDLINPLTRDERCEFKSIPNYSDTRLKVPVDYKAHLFYLGLDNSELQAAMVLKDDINAQLQEKRQARERLCLITDQDPKDIRAQLNSLIQEADRMAAHIKHNQLKAFESMDADSQQCQTDLKRLRYQIAALRHKIKQAETLTQDEAVDMEAVKIIYDKAKQGFGQAVEKQLAEAIDFKQTIAAYTKNMANKSIKKMQQKLYNLEAMQHDLLHKRDALDQDSALFAYEPDEIHAALGAKRDKIASITQLLDCMDQVDTSIKTKKHQLNQAKLNLEALFSAKSEILNAFERLILVVHQGLLDNASASFEITTNNRREMIEFVLRVKEDGSYSNERAKVFIYDFCALLHDATYSNHLGFLIHDNIFSHDNDTLQKALNYIEEKLSQHQDKQYILTLNSDKLASIDLNFNIQDYQRAQFTKSAKFLKCDYDEVN